MSCRGLNPGRSVGGRFLPSARSLCCHPSGEKGAPEHGEPCGVRPCPECARIYGKKSSPGRAARGAGKAAGSAIRLKLTLLIAAALIAIAVMLYLLFFKAGTPEDTVQKMEDALNRMDQQALLECFDEQSQGIYSGLLGVGGELLNFDLGALSDLASGLGGYMSAAGLTPQFDLTVVDVEYTGDDTCLVTVDFAVTYQGTSDTDTQVLPMVKDGRDWVVSAAGLQ